MTLFAAVDAVDPFGDIFDVDSCSVDGLWLKFGLRSSPLALSRTSSRRDAKGDETIDVAR